MLPKKYTFQETPVLEPVCTVVLSKIKHAVKNVWDHLLIQIFLAADQAVKERQIAPKKTVTNCQITEEGVGRARANRRVCTLVDQEIVLEYRASSRCLCEMECRLAATTYHAIDIVDARISLDEVITNYFQVLILCCRGIFL